jgi:hypothetical protein
MTSGQGRQAGARSDAAMPGFGPSFACQRFVYLSRADWTDAPRSDPAHFGPNAAVGRLRTRATGRRECDRGRLRSQHSGLPSHADRHGGVGGVRPGLFGSAPGQGRTILPAQRTTARAAFVLHTILGGSRLLGKPSESAEQSEGDRGWAAFPDPRPGIQSHSTLAWALVTRPVA